VRQIGTIEGLVRRIADAIAPEARSTQTAEGTGTDEVPAVTVDEQVPPAAGEGRADQSDGVAALEPDTPQQR
jgi:hypothetical protein